MSYRELKFLTQLTILKSHRFGYVFPHLCFRYLVLNIGKRLSYSTGNSLAASAVFFFSCRIDFGGRHFESREGVGRVCSHRLLVIIHHALMTCADVHESPSQARLHLRLLVRVLLHLHRPFSLGGHVETRGKKASLGQTRIQGEAYRAKTKLFILLRLKMAAV